jgi:hypothetical protein
LSVLSLTPSLFATSFCVVPVDNRVSNSNLHKGGESCLVALITRWQKGFRNHPFRHFPKALPLNVLGFLMGGKNCQSVSGIVSENGEDAVRLQLRRLNTALILPQNRNSFCFVSSIMNERQENAKSVARLLLLLFC